MGGCADLVVIHLASYSLIQRVMVLNEQALGGAEGVLQKYEGPAVKSVLNAIVKFTLVSEHYRQLGADLAFKVHDPSRINLSKTNFFSTVCATCHAVLRQAIRLGCGVIFVEFALAAYALVMIKTGVDRVLDTFARLGAWANGRGGMLGFCVSYLVVAPNYTVVIVRDTCKDLSDKCCIIEDFVTVVIPKMFA